MCRRLSGEQERAIHAGWVEPGRAGRAGIAEPVINSPLGRVSGEDRASRWIRWAATRAGNAAPVVSPYLSRPSAGHANRADGSGGCKSMSGRRSAPV
jgi:hypothetical protein